MNLSPYLLHARSAQNFSCQLCLSIVRHHNRHRRRRFSFALASGLRPQRPRLRGASQAFQKGPPGIRASQSCTPPSLTGASGSMPKTPAAAGLQQTQRAIAAILNSNTVPSEESVLAVLRDVQAASKCLAAPLDSQKQSAGPVALPTPASVLLGIASHSVGLSKSTEELSALLLEFMKHPPVFISPMVLDAYVRVQSILNHPESFPEIFHLYANKPVAAPNQLPVKFKASHPRSPAAAVPSDVVNRALGAAINAKNLHLALSIIELTFRQPSYRRALIIRKVMPPCVGLALAPGAAYVLATRFADYQQVVNPQSATQLAMAGILAYMGAVSTIGVVAVTTANDQMDRITWATGMALSERFLREDERAATDRVAQAWGFKDPNRRGEEEGEEWEELREWTGLRGMVLDKTELMQSMH